MTMMNFVLKSDMEVNGMICNVMVCLDFLERYVKSLSKVIVNFSLFRKFLSKLDKLASW